MSNERPWIAIIAGAAGGAIAIAAMEMLAVRAALRLEFIPFATSIVIVMGAPEVKPAQPRAIAGGHLLSAVVGLAVVKLVGPQPWAAAVAVGLAMIVICPTAFSPFPNSERSR